MLNILKNTLAKFLFTLSLILCSVTANANANIEEVFTADGILMETLLDTNGVPKDAIAVIEVDVPDESSLVIPMTFSGDPETVTLQVFFNDAPLEILSGILGKSESIDYLILDTNSYRKQTGELKLVLQNSGTDVSELFIIESVNYTDADITTVYGDTSTGVNANGGGSGGSVGIQTILLLVLIGLIGVARRKKT